MFEKIGSIKKPFAVNVVLSWVFCLLSIGTVNMKPGANLTLVFVLLAFSASVVNVLFYYIIQKTRRAYLYYLFVACGGVVTLSIAYICAFEIIDGNAISFITFWGLFIMSLVVMMYIFYNGLNSEIFGRKLVARGGNHKWSASFDVCAEANVKYGRLTNLIRNILAPFAPALGMAFSRNFEGQRELVVLGFVMLSLGLIMSFGYLKHFMLGLKFLYWQKTNQLEIEITDD